VAGGSTSLLAVFSNILVGTDGSETAAKAVDRAVQVASTVGAKLTIMTVGRETEGKKVVDAEAARHKSSGVDIDTRVVSGDPASILVDAAESGGYDLLVVGNKGMTGVSRFFLGSVPNKVSHHVPCSLLIVRTT
jgi:nucleotide-binding universal stress UspA family protein